MHLQSLVLAGEQVGEAGITACADDTGRVRDKGSGSPKKPGGYGIKR